MRKTAVCILVLGAAGALMTASAGFASPGNLRFSIDAGYARPTDETLDGSKGSFAGQAGIGFPITRRIAAELNLGYLPLGSSSFMYFPPGQDFSSASERVTLIPIAAGLSYTLPTLSGTRLFGSAGLGVYVLRVASDTPDVPGYSNSRLGFNVGGGFLFPGERLSPRLDFRFQDRTGINDEAGIGGATGPGRIHVFTAMLGVLYR